MAVKSVSARSISSCNTRSPIQRPYRDRERRAPRATAMIPRLVSAVPGVEILAQDGASLKPPLTEECTDQHPAVRRVRAHARACTRGVLERSLFSQSYRALIVVTRRYPADNGRRSVSHRYICVAMAVTSARMGISPRSHEVNARGQREAQRLREAVFSLEGDELMRRLDDPRRRRRRQPQVHVRQREGRAAVGGDPRSHIVVRRADLAGGA